MTAVLNPPGLPGQAERVPGLREYDVDLWDTVVRVAPPRADGYVMLGELEKVKRKHRDPVRAPWIFDCWSSCRYELLFGDGH